MPYSGLLHSLNRCIRVHFNELLESDAWFAVGPPPVLDVKRVCSGVDYAAFIVSLWTGDPVCAMYEFMEKLNIVMVMLDQFFELCGDCVGPVSAETKALWGSMFSPQCANVNTVMPEYYLMDKILVLSDPLKLETAIKQPASQLELCRLYRDDLDAAVELLSQQITIVQDRVFSLIA